jgi:polyribonucleotide nucleotidyltransferase
VNAVSDFLKEGQKVRVKVIEADDKGRLRLSMKAAMADDAAAAGAPAEGGAPAAAPEAPAAS